MVQYYFLDDKMEKCTDPEFVESPDKAVDLVHEMIVDDAYPMCEVVGNKFGETFSIVKGAGDTICKLYKSDHSLEFDSMTFLVKCFVEDLSKVVDLNSSRLIVDSDSHGNLLIGDGKGELDKVQDEKVIGDLVSFIKEFNNNTRLALGLVKLNKGCTGLAFTYMVKESRPNVADVIIG